MSDKVTTMVDILPGAATKINSILVPDDDHRDNNDDHDHNSFGSMVDTMYTSDWDKYIISLML